MKTEILATGSELLLGLAANSNAAYLSRELASLGIAVDRHVVVGDDMAAMVSAIRESVSRSACVFITGGLGPTGDDITREAVAEAFGVPLFRDPLFLKRIEERYARYGRILDEASKKQASFPQGAVPLPNPNGTAPGFALEQEGRIVIALPGVPSEMEAIFEREAVPLLQKRFQGGSIFRLRKMKIFGLFESDVEKRIGPLLERNKNPLVGITSVPGMLSLTIRGEGETEEEAERIAEEGEKKIRAALGENHVGIGGQSLEEEVALLLEREEITLATAESCTGGLIARSLVRVPGISRFFLEGIVSYSNSAKERLLGVPRELIAEHGAVSEEVALAMVRGVVERSGAKAGISVTGIAGPDGGTPEKPVGLVYVGIKHRFEEVRRYLLAGSRERIQLYSAARALTALRRHLLGSPSE